MTAIDLWMLRKNDDINVNVLCLHCHATVKFSMNTIHFHASKIILLYLVMMDVYKASMNPLIFYSILSWCNINAVLIHFLWISNLNNIIELFSKIIESHVVSWWSIKFFRNPCNRKLSKAFRYCLLYIISCNNNSYFVHQKSTESKNH